jgi:hypothetical protein
VSTRCTPQTRLPARACQRLGARAPAEVAADAVAAVVCERRELLLRAHGFRLRREDLEVYRSGVRAISEIVRDNPLAQDYVRWGAPGPGRWVTIYSTTSPTDHAFMTIAGLRLDTSHDGTDVGPNRLQDGARWRIFGQIPTWAHWSVRHPPGL